MPRVGTTIRAVSAHVLASCSHLLTVTGHLTSPPAGSLLSSLWTYSDLASCRDWFITGLPRFSVNLGDMCDPRILVKGNTVRKTLFE